jgi:hypothetical protein
MALIDDLKTVTTTYRLRFVQQQVDRSIRVVQDAAQRGFPGVYIDYPDAAVAEAVSGRLLAQGLKVDRIAPTYAFLHVTWL